MDYRKLTSETIDFLRFPLIIGVIFIHSYSLCGQFYESNDLSGRGPFYYITTLFSDVLATVAVPIFFFISGYLFFRNIDVFDHSAYLDKIRKRFKSLVIPYLFWNLAVVGFYLLIGKIPALSAFVNGYSPGVQDILVGRIGADGTNYFPAAYQFWFIRDLIVCVFISPVLYLIIRKTWHIGLILLGVGWFLGYSIPYIGTKGFSLVSMFFFSCGGWFCFQKKELIAVFEDLRFFAWIYPLIALADLVTKGETYNLYIHNLGILSGVMFCFLLSAVLIRRYNFRMLPFLSAASFFVFAIHEPWLLTILKKFIFASIAPRSEAMMIAIYFLTVFFVALLSVAIYRLMKRCFPSITRLISGGR